VPETSQVSRREKEGAASEAPHYSSSASVLLCVATTTTTIPSATPCSEQKVSLHQRILYCTYLRCMTIRRSSVRGCLLAVRHAEIMVMCALSDVLYCSSNSSLPTRF
jgi:hypothetical protein